MSPTNPNLPLTKQQLDDSVALLAQWRIDANSVAADGWDRDGYEVFVAAAAGEVVRYERRDWPIDFPVDKLIAIRGGIGR